MRLAKIMNRFLVFFLLLGVTTTYGQDSESFDAVALNQAITDDTTLQFSVDGDSDLVSYENAMAFVSLRTDNASTSGAVWYRLRLDLEITPTLADQSFDTENSYTVSLQVEQNTLSNTGGEFADLSKHAINKHYGARVRIVATTYEDIANNGAAVNNASIPEDVVLEIGFAGIKHFAFDDTSTVTVTAAVVPDSNDLGLS